MTDNLEVEFTLDADAAFEGMVLAGRRVYRGQGRWLMIGMYLVQGLLVPLGTVGAFVLGHQLITGDIPRGPYWFTVAFLIGAGLGLGIMSAVYKRMARMVVTTGFGKGGRMLCDARGVTLTTDESIWKTGWRDVEELVLGKQSLGIAVSGIVLILPISAFRDRDAMKAAHDQLAGWFEAAREQSA